MNLFELVENKLQIQPEAYALLPFKKLWDRDKSKDKKVALEELAYVYYISDYLSDFSDIIDEDEQIKEVKKYCITDSKWIADKEVLKAVEFYKSRQETTALIMFENARHGINKLSIYMRDINFNETDMNEKTGEIRPKHDIKKFADTVRQIPSILESLKQLENAVKKEREAEKGLRGGREKSPYEDE
jgi:hypothetical protein